jgi:hypothetical protein
MKTPSQRTEALTGEAEGNSEEPLLERLFLRALVGLLVIALLVSAGVLISYFVIFSGSLSTSQDRWGQFGDYVGGVLNPLFALLAFTALLYTIYLQKRELGLSRVELRRSSNALEMQADKQRRQQFESTFFHLLELHNEIVREMRIVDPDAANVGKRGRVCFESHLELFQDCYGQIEREIENADAERIIDEAYRRAFKGIKRRKEEGGTITGFQHHIGHYFRNLFTIVSFIDSTKSVDPKAMDDPKQFTNIVRAQLSSYELALLFYNCLAAWGREKFKPLVEKYALLENMDSSLLREARHKQLYEPSAFGSPEE